MRFFRLQGQNGELNESRARVNLPCHLTTLQSRVCGSKSRVLFRCEGRAKELLVFYRHPDETGFSGQWSVEDNVKKVGTVAALSGKRRYDVLELWGNVYKGRYRMRFIYAIVRGQCVLMGEEIFEDANL